MQEEKVRQCKVFVVLMQGENSCWERSDAAAAPAWTWVYVAQMGSTFYSPLPLCFFLNGEKEVESTTDLQRYYVNKRSNMPQQWFGGIWTAGSQPLNEPVDFSQSHNNNFYHKLEKNWKIFTSFYISPFCIASVWFWLSLYVFSVTFRRLYRSPFIQGNGRFLPSLPLLPVICFPGQLPPPTNYIPTALCCLLLQQTLLESMHCNTS